MKLKFSFILATFILCLISFAAFAQDPGDPGGGDPGGNPNTAVPIDSGLFLLLGAGIGYGAKKAVDLNQQRKKNKNPQSNI